MGDCNCSRWRRLDWVVPSVAAVAFSLESGEANLTTYHFSTEAIEHLFRNTTASNPSRAAATARAMNW